MIIKRLLAQGGVFLLNTNKHEIYALGISEITQL